MSSFQYYVASSLDGYIADRENGLGWLLEFGMDEYAAHYERFMADVGAVVMGAKTFDFLVAESSAAWPYDVPSWVLTHGRELPASFAGADIRFTGGRVESLEDELRAAAGRGNIWVVGGGEVAAQFAHAGLLDELLVTVMPMILGDGSPVLPVVRHRKLEAIGSSTFPSGAVELRYRLTGDMSA